MFDAAVCGQMKSTELPHVDCAALLALKHLLSAATGSSELDVVQAQHHSGSAGGAGNSLSDWINNPEAAHLKITAEDIRFVSQAQSLR